MFLFIIVVELIQYLALHSTVFKRFIFCFYTVFHHSLVVLLTQISRRRSESLSVHTNTTQMFCGIRKKAAKLNTVKSRITSCPMQTKTIYYTKKLLRKAEAFLQNFNIKLCKSSNFAKEEYMLVIPTGKKDHNSTPVLSILTLSLLLSAREKKYLMY